MSTVSKQTYDVKDRVHCYVYVQNYVASHEN